ncbi:MAG: enoyl-CoA hydratase/isomerase family protein [Acidimicrobiia bacterium]
MADRAELVLVEHIDDVAVISFNRPERHNALNDEMGERWRDVLRKAIADTDVRCILLRGEGRSFSSGRDTSQLGMRVAGEPDLTFVRRHQAIRLETMAAPKPVVAAIKGFCLGGAFEIALSADMRVASTDALFAFPEVKYGLMADTGGTQLLTPLIGPSKSKYLHLTGERLDAQTALDWGVVDFLVPPDELDGAALALARKLATAPPLAAAMIKQTVDQAWAATISTGIQMELFGQVALFGGEEHRVTKAAALEQLRAAKQ